MTAPEPAPATPGQAPEVYCRWLKVDQPKNWDGPSESLIQELWREKSIEQKAFWRSLDQQAAVAAAAGTLTGDLRAVAAEAIAAYEASISYDETPHDRSRIAGWRARLAAAQPASGEVVHLSPPDGTYATPCCEQNPYDLPRSDRITNDPALATCEQPAPAAAPELAARWELPPDPSADELRLAAEADEASASLGTAWRLLEEAREKLAEVAAEAARLEESAGMTAPSKKSEIERLIAKRLRQALGDA